MIADRTRYGTVAAMSNPPAHDILALLAYRHRLGQGDLPSVMSTRYGVSISITFGSTYHMAAVKRALTRLGAAYSEARLHVWVACAE